MVSVCSTKRGSVANGSCQFLCFPWPESIMQCSHASHPYVRNLQTCTTVAAYSGFVLEQHQPSIKKPAVSTTTFSKFSSLST